MKTFFQIVVANEGIFERGCSGPRDPKNTRENRAETRDDWAASQEAGDGKLRLGMNYILNKAKQMIFKL